MADQMESNRRSLLLPSVNEISSALRLQSAAAMWGTGNKRRKKGRGAEAEAEAVAGLVWAGLGCLVPGKRRPGPTEAMGPIPTTYIRQQPTHATRGLDSTCLVCRRGSSPSLRRRRRRERQRAWPTPSTCLSTTSSPRAGAPTNTPGGDALHPEAESPHPRCRDAASTPALPQHLTSAAQPSLSR